VHTEWSVRHPSGNVWTLSPASERHARATQAREGGGELVTREVRTIAGPWVAVTEGGDRD